MHRATICAISYAIKGTCFVAYYADIQSVLVFYVFYVLVLTFLHVQVAVISYSCANSRIHNKQTMASNFRL